MTVADDPTPSPPVQPIGDRESVTIRFAGDSGDGMQLAGIQFSNTSAVHGNDVAAIPLFPAEIRAPAGSLAGVAAFQLRFGSTPIPTPGDTLDVLVAMNPAALKTNLQDLRTGGVLIVNADTFGDAELDKAHYRTNPLTDRSLAGFRVLSLPITQLTRDAVAGCELSTREADRCQNFFALGLTYWMYDRSPEQTLKWIREKFAKNPQFVEANTRALKAGCHYGETTHILPAQHCIARASLPPGTYRQITGTEAIVLGLVAAAELGGRQLVYASHPSTPACSILEELANLRRFGVKTFQAEDELAAAGVAVGASYGGAIGITGTSSPGMCLTAEAIGLAVMAELPLVVINFQRGGPSIGLPTKPEQADLLQALFGRNGESPAAIVAPRSPADCFDMALEAVRIATRFMCPVILLSDGYLAASSEPWKIPISTDLPDPARFPPASAKPVAFTGPVHDNVTEAVGFQPYQRDELLARPWAVPGTPELEHRIGGLEKQATTGNVNYEPKNHETMVKTRAAKVENIARTIPDLEVTGPEDSELLVVGWGGTYGSIAAAVERVRRRGSKVAHTHFRYLNPMPANTEVVLQRFKTILVPEMNTGQLTWLLRARYLAPARALPNVQARPFLVAEIAAAIESALNESNSPGG